MQSSIIQNIRSRSKFIESQVKVGRSRPELQAAQVTQLCSSFAQCTLDLDDVAAITDVLDEGPWTADEVIMMSTRLSDAALSQPSHHFGSRKLQHISNVEYLHTNSDYLDFSNPDLSLNPKAMSMAKRWHALGISCASVPLLKRGASILRMCHFGPETPLDGPSKQALCYKIKEAVKTLDETKRNPLPHIVRFPDRPTDLDPDRLAVAYPSEAALADPTEYIDIDTLNIVMKDMVYRNTHKELREAPRATQHQQQQQQQPHQQQLQVADRQQQLVHHQPHPQPQQQDHQQQQQPMQQILSMFAAFMQHQQHQPHQSPPPPPETHQRDAPYGSWKPRSVAMLGDGRPQHDRPSSSVRAAVEPLTELAPSHLALADVGSPDAASIDHADTDRDAVDAVADMERSMRACSDAAKAKSAANSKANAAAVSLAKAQARAHEAKQYADALAAGSPTAGAQPAVLSSHAGAPIACALIPPPPPINRRICAKRPPTPMPAAKAPSPLLGGPSLPKAWVVDHELFFVFV